MGIYIFKYSINEYDQLEDGHYFGHCWTSKPDFKEVAEKIKTHTKIDLSEAEYFQLMLGNPLNINEYYNAMIEEIDSV